MAVEDIVNQALDLIGYQRHIGNIYDGSPAARVALNLYGQTRDELLYQGDWQFARKEAALVDATATHAPTSPWTVTYTLPNDLIRLRYLRPGPLGGGARAVAPVPVLFELRVGLNDVRLVMAEASGLIGVYTANVLDPDEWDKAFRSIMVFSLARKFRARLAVSPAQVSEESADARDT